MKNWRASEELMKELRSLYQGLPMARQALDKGDITGARLAAPRRSRRHNKSDA